MEQGNSGKALNYKEGASQRKIKAAQYMKHPVHAGSTRPAEPTQLIVDSTARMRSDVDNFTTDPRLPFKVLPMEPTQNIIHLHLVMLQMTSVSSKSVSIPLKLIIPVLGIPGSLLCPLQEFKSKDLKFREPALFKFAGKYSSISNAETVPEF